MCILDFFSQVTSKIAQNLKIDFALVSNHNGYD